MHLRESLIHILCICESTHARSVKAQRVAIKARHTSVYLVESFTLLELNFAGCLRSVTKEALQILITLVAVQLVVHPLGGHVCVVLWHLRVVVVGVGNDMLVPIEIQVKLKFLQ